MSILHSLYLKLTQIPTVPHSLCHLLLLTHPSRITVVILSWLLRLRPRLIILLLRWILLLWVLIPAGAPAVKSRRPPPQEGTISGRLTSISWARVWKNRTVIRFRKVWKGDPMSHGHGTQVFFSSLQFYNRTNHQI